MMDTCTSYWCCWWCYPICGNYSGFPQATAIVKRPSCSNPESHCLWVQTSCLKVSQSHGFSKVTCPDMPSDPYILMNDYQYHESFYYMWSNCLGCLLFLSLILPIKEILLNKEDVFCFSFVYLFHRTYRIILLPLEILLFWTGERRGIYSSFRKFIHDPQCPIMWEKCFL